MSRQDLPLCHWQMCLFIVRQRPRYVRLRFRCGINYPDTDLGGKGLHTFGVPLDEFTDAIVEQLKMGSIEATYGFSVESSRATREQLEAIFKEMNQPL
jgi:hypothetical protein